MGDNTSVKSIESYMNALPKNASYMFSTEGESRAFNAVKVIQDVESGVGIDYWRTADVTDKLYILDLADGINNAGFRHMNINDIVEEMKHVILDNSTNTIVDAWCWVTLMTGIFGEGKQREVNPTNMSNIKAAILTDVQLFKEKYEDTFTSNPVIQPIQYTEPTVYLGDEAEPVRYATGDSENTSELHNAISEEQTVFYEETDNQHVNHLLVAAVQADTSTSLGAYQQGEMLLANTGNGIENESSCQTNTIVKELTEEQYKFLECGTTSREAMALPVVIPGKPNPYQVMALVTQAVEPVEEVYSEQDVAEDNAIVIDVTAEELKEVEAIEQAIEENPENSGTIRFGNVASSGKYAHYCTQIMARAIPKRNQDLVRDLRRALIREVNGQEAIALYIMLYDEATQSPYAPGISIFKEMLCKDKLSKRIAGNISGKFDFLNMFNVLTTSSKGWSDFMNLSAVKAFKLDDIYYMLMTEQDQNITTSYVDVWGEKCQAKQDGVFEDKEVKNVYMYSEPVQLRDCVWIRYLMVWSEKIGLNKGIIISGSLQAEPNRVYNAVFLSETTGKGYINWKLSEAVFENIVVNNDGKFFDKQYEASEPYYEKYGAGMEGYEPLNIEAPSQGSMAYRAGRLFGKTKNNIDYAAEVIHDAPGKAVDAAKRTVENVKTGVSDAYRDVAAGYKESVSGDSLD